MKCLMCGRIVRRDHGRLVAHPCAAPRKPRKRRTDVADRETQHGRYIDSGPGAWDDR